MGTQDFEPIPSRSAGCDGKRRKADTKGASGGRLPRIKAEFICPDPHTKSLSRVSWRLESSRVVWSSGPTCSLRFGSMPSVVLSPSGRTTTETKAGCRRSCVQNLTLFPALSFARRPPLPAPMARSLGAQRPRLRRALLSRGAERDALFLGLRRDLGRRRCPAAGQAALVWLGRPRERHRMAPIPVYRPHRGEKATRKAPPVRDPWVVVL